MTPEDHLIKLGERIMETVTQTMLDIGIGSNDGIHEDAEDAALDCVRAIAELLELPCDFEVTDEFRQRLNTAIHNAQIAMVSIHEAERGEL